MLGPATLPPAKYPKSLLLVAASVYLAALKLPFGAAVAVSFAYSILCTNVLLPVDGLLGSQNPPP